VRRFWLPHALCPAAGPLVMGRCTPGPALLNATLVAAATP
jgi:hypothetical protein